MTIALTILALLCIVGLPVPIVYLTRKNKILGAIGAIACCYIVGFIFSTIGLTGISYDKGLTQTIAYVLVAISIPLILFSIDLRSIKKLTKPMIIGYSLCIVSVVAVSFAIFFITYKFEPSRQLSSMIVGLYTGGTPNMNAIGAAMKADGNIISAANIADTLIGGVYFLFLISIAPKVYRFILNRKNKSNENSNLVTSEVETKKDDYTFGFKDKKSILKLCGSFALAIGCVGIGALLELLIEGTIGSNLLYILLSVSILGIVFSFVKPIRNIKGQYTLGMYLILMFSLALSMSIDWNDFLTGILPIFAFFACAQIGVIVIHIILCKIFRIDGDTAIITSTAGVYGPPFIAPVAKAANRHDLIAPGVICGALGLAIGTLLGIGLGQIFLLF